MIYESAIENVPVYVSEEEEKGCVLIANRDYKSGEMIAEESPLWFIFKDDICTDSVTTLTML